MDFANFSTLSNFNLIFFLNSSVGFIYATKGIAECFTSSEISQPLYPFLSMKIGKFLVNRGLLELPQVVNILKEQQKANAVMRMRFGRIAIDKGYITEKALNVAMLEKYQTEDKQKKVDPKYSFLIK